MAIQILNKNNEAIHLEDIDKKVSELWDVKNCEKYYAKPNIQQDGRNIYLPSWFDSLAKIAHIHKQTFTAAEIKEKYLEPFINMSGDFWEKLTLEEKMLDLKNDKIVASYVKILDYWIQENYTIKYIAD